MKHWTSQKHYTRHRTCSSRHSRQSLFIYDHYYDKHTRIFYESTTWFYSINLRIGTPYIHSLMKVGSLIICYVLGYMKNWYTLDCAVAIWHINAAVLHLSWGWNGFLLRNIKSELWWGEGNQQEKNFWLAQPQARRLCSGEQVETKIN